MTWQGSDDHDLPVGQAKGEGDGDPHPSGKRGRIISPKMPIPRTAGPEKGKGEKGMPPEKAPGPAALHAPGGKEVFFLR